MNQIGEIVYRAETANGNIVCQFTKTAQGYLREQILSTGLIMEEDYTEEEYQGFLAQVSRFDALSASKQEEDQKKIGKPTRKK
jgi:hypothetical protein